MDSVLTSTAVASLVGFAGLAAILYHTRPCCPCGSVPAVEDTSPLRGQMITLGGRQCYVSGTRSGATAVVIVCHDIYGLMSGRTRLICDELAARLDGTLVILPDFFNDRCDRSESGSRATARPAPPPARLKPCLPSRPPSAFRTPSWPADKPMEGTWAVLRYMTPRLHRRWAGLEPFFAHTLLPFARAAMTPAAAGRIALVGFCWGSWCNLRACAAFPDAFCAAVGFHPSPVLCYLHGDALCPLLAKV